jgi:glutathione S-transferase
MSDVILHHYEVSPFSEKIRKVLAHKGLAWRGVEQPSINPKPKLIPLTGGYRRIPVLQIGADVYCDTACIARVLETRHPEPSLFPSASQGAAEIIAHWADHWLFLASVPPAIGGLLPVLPKEFVADRQAMSPGFTVENLQRATPDARSRLVAALEWLDAQLRGRSFLLGDAFSLADAACFHVLWFLRNSPDAFVMVENRPALRSWFERVEAMGRGEMTALDPDEALAIARQAKPATRDLDDGTDPNGIAPGIAVTVRADDYGTDPISGVAAVVTAQEIALRREHPEVGEVVVHFPRAGFTVARA